MGYVFGMMTGMFRAKWTMPVLAVILLAGTAAAKPVHKEPPVLAKNLGRYEIVRSETATLRPGEGITLYPRCTGGRMPLGAGLVNGSRTGSVQMAASYPWGDAWAVEARYVGGEGETLWAYGIAVCGFVQAYHTLMADLVTVNGNTSSFQAQQCENAFVTYGGGGVFLGGTQSLVLGTYPITRHMWATEMYNFNSFPVDMRVFAVCGWAVDGFNVVTGREAVISTGQYIPVTVDCPEGTVAIAGGAHIYGDQLFTTDSYPLNETSWRIWVRGGGETDILRAYAVCADR